MRFNRAQLRALRAENRAWPDTLIEIPESSWPAAIKLAQTHQKSRMVRAFRSEHFLAMLFLEPSGYQRLSVLRTDFEGVGKRAVAGIVWDDLQRLKGEAGFADAWAVEVFPPDADVVNVQNMRHLFLLPEPPSFGWHKAAP